MVPLQQSHPKTVHMPMPKSAHFGEVVCIPNAVIQGCLQVINEAVSDAPATSAASHAFMHLLSWLASAFASIVKQHKATNTTTWGSIQTEASTAKASIPISADFGFAAILLQPLLLCMQQPTVPPAAVTQISLTQQSTSAGRMPEANTAGQQAAVPSRKQRKRSKANATQQQADFTAADAVPMHWSVAANGAAVLIDTMAAGNIYRPTEDTNGSHRQLLTAVADAVLKQAKQLLTAACDTGRAVIPKFRLPLQSHFKKPSLSTLHQQRDDKFLFIVKIFPLFSRLHSQKEKKHLNCLRWRLLPCHPLLCCS